MADRDAGALAVTLRERRSRRGQPWTWSVPCNRIVLDELPTRIGTCPARASSRRAWRRPRTRQGVNRDRDTFALAGADVGRTVKADSGAVVVRGCRGAPVLPERDRGRCVDFDQPDVRVGGVCVAVGRGDANDVEERRHGPVRVVGPAARGCAPGGGSGRCHRSGDAVEVGAGPADDVVRRNQRWSGREVPRVIDAAGAGVDRPLRVGDTGRVRTTVPCESWSLAITRSGGCACSTQSTSSGNGSKVLSL